MFCMSWYILSFFFKGFMHFFWIRVLLISSSTLEAHCECLSGASWPKVLLHTDKEHHKS